VIVRSVGIDLSITGMHRAEAIDEKGNRCGHVKFRTTPEGLALLSGLCFRDGSAPIIVLEPTGLAWLPMVSFLKANCPQATMVRAKQQKVAALRRVLREHAKSDRIDALTLARLPLVDPEHLEPLALPSADMQRLDRLTRRRDRLATGVANRKTRISALLMGLFPGLWECFQEPWNPRARWIYRHRLNPFRLHRMAPERLEAAFIRVTPTSSYRVIHRESTAILAISRRLAEVYQPSRKAGLITDTLFKTWQEEISLELDLLEGEEAQIGQLEQEIDALYRSLHPHDHLRSIPGVGPRTAPLLLAAAGDIHRFHSVKAFQQWTGVPPRSHQSSNTQRFGLGMGKAGPARVKRALYQAGQYARRWDPQLAALYYRQMVGLGKTHKQAMGAVMNHLAARVYAVLTEERPYKVRDFEGRPLSSAEAGKLIRENFRVSDEIRQLRRHNHRPNKRKTREETIHSAKGWPDQVTEYGAASAPQSDLVISAHPISNNIMPKRASQLVAQGT
jgi:transposase